MIQASPTFSRCLKRVLNAFPGVAYDANLSIVKRHWKHFRKTGMFFALEAWTILKLPPNLGLMCCS